MKRNFRRSNEKQKQEFAVIGLGRFGSSLAINLENNGCRVLGIDKDRELVQLMSDQISQVVGLNAADTAALAAIDITSFDTVIVAIGTDFESNLLTTAALKELGVKNIICKAINDRQRTILLKVGADRVLLPEIEAGEHLARELLTPHLRSHLPLDSGHSLVEIQAPAAVIGKTLSEAEIRNAFGLTVLMIRSGDQQVVAPPAETRIRPGDLLIVLGSNEDLDHFVNLPQQ